MIANQRALQNAYNISLWVLVLIPFVLAFAGGVVGGVSAGVFVVAMGLGIFVPSIAKRVPEAFWTFLVLTVFVVAGIRFFATDADLLSVGVEMLVFLASVRLVSRLSPREDLQLFALSFLLLAAATVVDEGILYGLLFALYVVVGTFSLTLFHFHSEIAVRADRDVIETSFNAKFLSALAAISVFILVASGAFFFAFPRVGLGFFAQQKRAGTQMAGFSTSVELGQHGRIRSNPEVVLRVEVDRSETDRLASAHWRTISFDSYDGKRWKRPDDAERRPLVTDHLHPWDRLSETTTLNIYLEPLGENVLPVLWPTRKVKLGSHNSPVQWGPSTGNLYVDELGDVRHSVQNELGMQYRIDVAGKRRTRSEVEPLDEDTLKRFLQTPPLSVEFKQLSDSIFQSDASANNNASAVVQHMHTNYTYTTDLPDGGDNPVDAFLFEHKLGHCEYFATSTVLLLRSAGIPARLVNGFLGGEWNGIGEYWAVRQGDAHSWVEYFDPKIGWVPIDPTPPSMADSRETSSWFSTVSDAAKLAWMKWVVEYDLSSQVKLATSLFANFKPAGLMKNEPDTPENAERSDLRLYVFAGGLFTLLVLGFVTGRRRPAWRRRIFLAVLVLLGAGVSWWFKENLWGVGAPILGFAAGFALRPSHLVDPVAESFLRLQAALKTVGLERASDEGSDRFLERAIARFPGNRELVQFRKTYTRTRFGGYETDQDALSRLSKQVQKSLSAQQS